MNILADICELKWENLENKNWNLKQINSLEIKCTKTKMLIVKKDFQLVHEH